MARATRSSALAEHRPPSPQQKKRKRADDPHAIVPSPPSSPAPPTKHPRTHYTTKHDPAASFLPFHDARNILDVLNLTDTQGLLDRVFPLPASPTPASSLRSLLQDPAHHPLTVIRDAIQHLRPISSHPRARISPTAVQQLRFCNLALDLLNQASRNSSTVPLDTESVLPSPSSSPSSPKSPRSPARKYALVQHLPSGDYWSSLNSDPTQRLADLPTAHAELAVVLPSPSTPFSSSIPSLATYHTRALGPKKPLPTQRCLTTAKFLDHGPWSSFAPSYDHDMEIVGRRDLGLILLHKEQRRRENEAVRREALEGSGSIMQVDDPIMVGGDSTTPHSVIDPSLSAEQSEPDLDGLLSEEDVVSLKAALGSLELERAVHQLLEKNNRALVRLEELQFKRLSKEGGGTSVTEEGSEEWETAQGILESLTVLSSLRPRAAPSEHPAIFPPPSVIRKLHRSLAIEPSAGWHGTLPPTRAVALRDDSTVKIRSTPTPVGTVASPTPDAPVAATPIPAPQAYAVYPYAYAAGQQAGTPYRATSVTTTPYAQYKPSQAGSFYQSYVPPAGQQHSSYYGQQSYTGAAAAAAAATGTQSYMATNQQPYAAYSSWYAQYPPQITTTAATAASGHGTPQPVPAYTGFFGGAGGTATPPPAASRTPAVANTVALSKTVPQQTTATWQYGQPTQQSPAVAPTLPAHLKLTQQGSVPQVYSPVAGAVPMTQQQYYGQYQPQPSTPATPAAR